MKTFINVEQMKLATLQAGQFVETGGYYAKGDAGAARYLIKAAQAFDTWGDHELVNGTIAVLQVGSIVNVEQFGAVGDSTGTGIGTDSFAAIYTAIHHPNVTEVRLLSVYYRSSDEINIQKKIRIVGGAAGTDSEPPCRIYFDTDKSGIVINNAESFSDQRVPYVKANNASGTIIDGVGLYGAGTDVTKHGYRVRARCTLENFYVTGFGGNGVHTVASSQGGTPDDEFGNANNWMMENGRSYSNGGHGFLVEGNDVNAGTAVNVDGTLNQGWGISDESFLGCTWVGCHTASNVIGPHRAINANARSAFIGQYTEGNQNPAYLNERSMALGGQNQVGTDGGGANWHESILADVAGLTCGNFREYGVRINNNASEGRAFLVDNLASLGQNRYSHVGFRNDGQLIGSMWGSKGDDTGGRLGFDIYRNNDTGYERALMIDGRTGKNFSPIVDGAWALGKASAKWGEIFSTNGTINTSDEREKQQVRSINEKELLCAKQLKLDLRAFKWNSAVELKGSDAARWHFGIMAQRVVEIFSDNGLDAMQYGMLCYDEWDEVVEELNDEGEAVVEGVTAGNRYGVRYDQLLAFIVCAI